MYNLTNITDNANNIAEIARATNDLSNGLYFSLMFIILFVVYLIAFKKQNFKIVLAAGSFFMVFISVTMFALHWVDQSFLIIPILLFFASILLLLFVQE